ncbi:hypothetical protein IWZ00DRAFT_520687 [Phyllosticta capitalensis]
MATPRRCGALECSLWLFLCAQLPSLWGLSKALDCCLYASALVSKVVHLRSTHQTTKLKVQLQGAFEHPGPHWSWPFLLQPAVARTFSSTFPKSLRNSAGHPQLVPKRR